MGGHSKEGRNVGRGTRIFSFIYFSQCTEIFAVFLTYDRLFCNHSCHQLPRICNVLHYVLTHLTITLLSHNFPFVMLVARLLVLMR